jgi:hypothetical protein
MALPGREDDLLNHFIWQQYRLQRCHNWWRQIFDSRHEVCKAFTRGHWHPSEQKAPNTETSHR